MTNFKKIFQKTNPSVVIFFHACGITNMLTQNLSLMRQIANKSLIIDDNVHRVIDTTNIKILHDRHLIVDSIRKNIPLPGSFVYSSRNTWSKLSSPRSHSSLYKLKVLSYFFIYRTILTLGITFHSKAMIKYAHHSTLQSHDNLVGDSLEGNSGLPWVPSIHRHINISKVRALKRKQVQTYQKQLSSLVNSSLSISIPSISKPDTGELHAFPIVIDMPLANIIENALIPLNVWSKFPDCTWSKSKRVFFLPLGFHITSIDQELITSTIIKSLQKL